MTRPMSFVNVLSCCTSKLTNRFTELLPTHGPSSSRCNSLLWLHVLFAVSWGWRDRQPLYLPSHELFWFLRGKGTRVRYCWIPGHCGFEGNETVDQLAKATIDQDIEPLASLHYTPLKPLVNSYIQQFVQFKWDVAVYGRYPYLVKPTLRPPKEFQHLSRAEEVVITRLRGFLLIWRNHFICGIHIPH